MDDRANRSIVASRYPSLQGLLMLPVGVWVAVVGLTSSRWWPWSEGGHGLFVSVPAGVVAVLAYYGIARYYERHFGRVELPQQRRTRQWLLATAGGAVIVVASVLGEVFRLPVNLYGVAAAIVLLATWGYGGVLRVHHLLLAAGLVILSVLPLGGSGFMGFSTTTSMTVVMLGIGVVCVCAGLMDHAYLVRWLGPARAVEGPVTNETSRIGI
jgi:hypothetical protein